MELDMPKCPACGHSFSGVPMKRWPPGYLNAESVYCAHELEAFYACPRDGEDKARLRKELLEKREAFKALWESKERRLDTKDI